MFLTTSQEPEPNRTIPRTRTAMKVFPSLTQMPTLQSTDRS